MKKLITILLSGVMAAGLCACNGGSGDSASASDVTEKTEISFSDDNFITWYGRCSVSDSAASFSYTASGFEVKFRGSELTMEFSSYGSQDEKTRQYLTVITDGKNYRSAPYYALDSDKKTLTVACGEGEHTVRVLKRSEASSGSVTLNSISLSSDETTKAFLKVGQRKSRFMEIYGDSITCGYGNVDCTQKDSFTTRTEDGLATYGFIAAEKLNAECSVLSVSGIAVCQNVWNSPIKLPALLTRSSYTDEKEYADARIPDVVVVNGGANDNTYINQAYGEEKQTRKEDFINAYANFLTSIRSRYPGVKIICCTNMLGEGSIMETLIGYAIERAGYNTDLVLLSLPSCERDGYGADGHPTYVTHEKAAEILIEKITEEMEW